MVMVEDWPSARESSLSSMSLSNFRRASEWAKADKTLNLKSAMLTWEITLFEVLEILSGGSIASNPFPKMDTNDMSSFSISYEGISFRSALTNT